MHFKKSWIRTRYYVSKKMYNNFYRDWWQRTDWSETVYKKYDEEKRMDDGDVV